MTVESQTSSREALADVTPRPAFDLFEGFAVTMVLASLHISGLLEPLEHEGLDVGPGAPDGNGALGGVDTELLEATLEYLARRGLARRRESTFELTELGRAVCRDKGYLVWISGGYAEPLRHLAAFLRGEQRYGIDHVRDGRWVAKGAALLGGVDVAPSAMELLGTISFDRALDIGCGDARFLTAVCTAFGCAGVGLDISPEACEEARGTVGRAGLDERIRVIEGDALAVDAIPLLAETQLVITFFLLHEISSVSRAAIVDYLERLAARLPAGAYLLAAEAEPPRSAEAAGERFTPEFTYVHAMMRQALLPVEEWRDVLAEGGFRVEQVVELGMPGGVLILARKDDPCSDA
jgi:2-ketoarginine methyltransferase